MRLQFCEVFEQICFAFLLLLISIKQEAGRKFLFTSPTQSKGQTIMSCLLTMTIDVMKHIYIFQDYMRRQIITYIVVKSDEELKS